MIISAKKTFINIISKLLTFLNKIKIIKNIDNIKKKVIKGLDNFYNSGTELKKNKKSFLISVLTNIIGLILLYIIPYIIFKSLNCNELNVCYSIILTSFVMLIGNFVPIPGATGGIEYGFVKLFRNININISVIFSAMLLWRFVTYFLGMLIGFIMLIIKEGVSKDEDRFIF